jgi:hypothetical protein
MMVSIEFNQYEQAVMRLALYDFIEQLNDCTLKEAVSALLNKVEEA